MFYKESVNTAYDSCNFIPVLISSTLAWFKDTHTGDFNCTDITINSEKQTSKIFYPQFK